MMIPWLVILVPMSVVLYSFSTRRRKTKNEPPLIRGWIPWIGCGLAFRRNALKFFRTVQRKYGSIFTVGMGGKYFTIITDARDYPAITKLSKSLNFKKAIGDVSARVFHLSHCPDLPGTRSTLETHLQGSGLLELDQTSSRVLRETLESIKVTDWSEISLLQLCYDIVFPSVFHTLFDQKKRCDEETIANMIRDFRHFDYMFISVALGTVSSKLEATKRLCRILKELSDVEGGHEMIERRHQMLREKAYQTRIGNEALCILWASMSNTVNTLFWCLHFALQQPSAVLKLKQEISATRLKRSMKTTNGDLSIKELEEMHLLDAILKETMRMTASSMSARRILQDVEFFAPSQKRTIRLRKDDTLLIPYQMTHYDTDIYENPAEFRYDRFWNGVGSAKCFYKKGNKLHCHLRPFGDGPSLCPGRQWAQIVIKRAFIMILESFEIKPVDATLKSKPAIDRFGFGILHPDIDEKVAFRSRISSIAET